MRWDGMGCDVMEGWMDGWMEGWMGGWMDGWMDRMWINQWPMNVKAFRAQYSRLGQIQQLIV